MSLLIFNVSVMMLLSVLSFRQFTIFKHANGFETVYAHLEDFGVEVGNEVGKGEVIGAIGSAGKSTGPHLHYEARKDGEHLNYASAFPEVLLRG